MLFLLGDSHTRSYTDSRYMKCIFIGNGAENNLSSFLQLFMFFCKIFVNCKCIKFKHDSKFGLVVGEPDVRLAVHGGYPLNRTLRPISRQFKSIEKSIVNFEKLLLWASTAGVEISFVIGCGSPNKDLCSLARTFNARLATILNEHGIIFFDPQIVFDNAIKKEIFLTKNVFEPEKDDYVHLSKKIACFFDKEIAATFNCDLKVPISLKLSSLILKINYHKKFDCFYSKYVFGLSAGFKIISLLDRVMKKIM
jgi:hypothetical protein